jgi:beta-phosphoglucomutase-like phosphatase (HAD superfamily)
VDPRRCVVVEDSHIGVKAAVAAGMTVFVTKSVSGGGGAQRYPTCPATMPPS